MRVVSIVLVSSSVVLAQNTSLTQNALHTSERFEAACGDGEIARALGISHGLNTSAGTCGSLTPSEGADICDVLNSWDLFNITEDAFGVAHAIDPDDAAVCFALNYLEWSKATMVMLLLLPLILLCCGYPLGVFCVAYVCCIKPRRKKGYSPIGDAWQVCLLVLVFVFWGLGIIGNICMPVIALAYCGVQGPCCMVLPFCSDHYYKRYTIGDSSDEENLSYCQHVIKPCLPIAAYGSVDQHEPTDSESDAVVVYCGPITCTVWLLIMVSAPMLFYAIAMLGYLDEPKLCFDKLDNSASLPPASTACNKSLVATGVIELLFSMAICVRPLDTLSNFPPRFKVKNSLSKIRKAGSKLAIPYTGKHPNERLSDDSTEIESPNVVQP